MLRTRKYRTKIFREQIEHEWKEKFKNLFEGNLDKPWDWRLISDNPNITWEIIQNNPNIDWHWYDDGICDNTMEKGRIEWINKKRLEIIKTLQIQRHWRNSFVVLLSR